MAAPIINDATIKQDIQTDLPDNSTKSISALLTRGILGKLVDWVKAQLTASNLYVQELSGDYITRFQSLQTTVYVNGTSGNDTTGTGASGAPFKTLNRAATLVNNKFTNVTILVSGTLDVAADVQFYVPYLTVIVSSGANTLRFKKRTIVDNAITVGEGHYRLLAYSTVLNIKVDGTLDIEASTGSTGNGNQFFWRMYQGAISVCSPDTMTQTGDQATLNLTTTAGGVSIGNNATLFCTGTHGLNFYGSRLVRFNFMYLGGSFTMGTNAWIHQGLEDKFLDTDVYTVHIYALGNTDGRSGQDFNNSVKTLTRAAQIVKGRYSKVRFILQSNVEVTSDIDLTGVDDFTLDLNGFDCYHRRKTVNTKQGTYAFVGMKNVLLTGTGGASMLQTEGHSAAPSDADYVSSTDFCYNQGAFRLGSAQYGGYVTGRFINDGKVNLGNYTTLVAAGDVGIFPQANGIEYFEASASIAAGITLGTKAYLGRRLAHMVIHRSLITTNDVYYPVVSAADHVLLSGNYEVTCNAKTVGYGGSMYASIWTCRLPWYAGLSNHAAEYGRSMEFMTHNNGGRTLQIRTNQSTGSTYNQTVDFKIVGESLSSAAPFRFEFRRLSYESNQAV